LRAIVKKKRCGYILLATLLTAVVLYNAVYFEKLDLKTQQERKRRVDPTEQVDLFWKTTLHGVLNTAIDLKSFDSLLVANPPALIGQYGRTVGISSAYSFVVKGTARTAGRDAEAIPVLLANGNATYSLRIRHIFGNAARDAVGYFQVDDFENTMDFNAVAAALNSLIAKDIVAKAFDGISPGTTVRFVGALAMDAEHRSQHMDIVPLHIEIIR
jgi:hypothetical protein